MFDTFKIYSQKNVSLDEVIGELTRLGYRRAEATGEEGDFSLRGDTLELFPVNFNFPVRIEWEFGQIDKIYSFDKTINKKIIDYELLIVIPFSKKPRPYKTEDLPLEAALQIKKGDYVVHSRYGIGKLIGLRKLKVREKENFYLEIEYDNKDKLYVSREDAHLLQKYLNVGIKKPKLSRLGSKEWARIREKVEKGVKVFAIAILKMEAQRRIAGGFKYPGDDSWQKKFEESFPYEETADQLKATADVKKDMQSSGCMDRIICGDVGYGKTEVAMRAAVKAVLAGKQVAFLVPTTILAYQHYVNLRQRLKEFPFYTEMLSRFRRAAQQKEILKKLNQGKIDIIVGTHRLISADVGFKDLGLLIIDEEHKFGVAHKNRIKRLKAGIDVLSLSATPIPRTLYMSLIGIRGISSIRTPPKQRLAIKTEVINFDLGLLKNAIIKELKRGGQVFFIHNRIQTISHLEARLRKVLPKDIRMAVIHGRLPAVVIEEVMLKFIK